MPQVLLILHIGICVHYIYINIYIYIFFFYGIFMFPSSGTQLNVKFGTAPRKRVASHAGQSSLNLRNRLDDAPLAITEKGISNMC